MPRSRRKITSYRPGRSEKDDPHTPGPGKDPWRGRSYHSFYEGYTEYWETTDKGKRRRRLVYTAPYYRFCLTPQQRRGMQILYVLCTILSVLLFAAASLRYVPSNYGRIPALFGALSIAFTFFFCVYLIPLLTGGERMIARKWRSLGKMTFLAKGAVLSDLLCAASALVYGFLYMSYLAAELLCVLMFLLAGALIAVIPLTQKRISCETVPNETVVDAEDSVLIEKLK